MKWAHIWPAECVLTSGDRFQWIARTGKRSLKKACNITDSQMHQDAREVVKCGQRLGGEKDL